MQTVATCLFQAYLMGRRITRPAVIDVPQGNGHVLLFSTNPFWRGQTKEVTS
jgi:hypothetical protein